MQSINVIGERVIMLGQTLSLSKELFSIIESYRKLLGFCSKFLNQFVKRGKTFTCEMPFLHFAIAFSNCFQRTTRVPLLLSLNAELLLQSIEDE